MHFAFLQSIEPTFSDEFRLLSKQQTLVSLRRLSMRLNQRCPGSSDPSYPTQDLLFLVRHSSTITRTYDVARITCHFESTNFNKC